MEAVNEAASPGVCSGEGAQERRHPMSFTEVVVEGTLKPDGTLELDQKPGLSPGRVQVIVKPLAATPTGRPGLVEVLDEIRQSQRARGYHGRTPQEMQAEETARQEEDADYEQRSEQLWGGPLPSAKS
jgi:hypothetical protein